MSVSSPPFVLVIARGQSVLLETQQLDAPGCGKNINTHKHDGKCAGMMKIEPVTIINQPI